MFLYALPVEGIEEDRAGLEWGKKNRKMDYAIVSMKISADLLEMRILIWNYTKLG